MSFPRYPKYKSSGIEWLGEVPEHWRVQRLRFIAEMNPSKAEISGVDRKAVVSFLPMEAVGDDGTLDLDREKTVGELESGYTYFREGDVTLAKITPCFENGKGALMLGLTNGIGFGTTELLVARPKPEEVTGEYLQYLFMSPIFRRLGESHMYGAGGQKRVPDSFVRDFAIGFPPIFEQRQISEFLSREIAKIKDLIAEQEQLVELLTVKRQSVVSLVVTRGLNPNVLLKPSGVEWLGDVPAHWDVTRIANLFREVAEPGTDELPILSVSIHHGVSDDELEDEEMERKISRSDDRSKYKQVSPGDLVYNMMRAWQGGFGTVTVKGMVSPAYVVARPLKRLDTAYVEHLLRTPPAIEQMRRHSRGITDFRLRLYWNEFKNLRVSVPPPAEANAICNKIAEMTDRFETMSAACEEAIAILRERRIGLISAAVTGKIDVRNLVPLQSEAA